MVEDTNADQFCNWRYEITRIMDNYLFSDAYRDALRYLLVTKDEVITRLPDHEIDEQLTFCSQYMATFREIRTMLKRYRSKARRRYRVWKAKKLIRVKSELLAKQKDEVDAKIRNKGNYDKLTKDDLENEFIAKCEVEWNRWHEYLEDVDRAHDFIDNLIEDMVNRIGTLKTLVYDRRH